MSGYTLGEISEATGIDRAKLHSRILLGERLLSLEGIDCHFPPDCPDLERLPLDERMR